VAGDAEVDEDQPLVVAHDVAGLEIEMGDAARVQRRERSAESDSDVEGVIPRHRAAVAPQPRREPLLQPCTDTTDRSRTRANMRASRLSMSAVPGSAALMATERPSSRSIASYTFAIPPDPISRLTW
jgi:hypothetical protein